jgi:hypothetical protein
MNTVNELEKRISDLQNHYQMTLLGSKEFSQLKAIKNSIKKLHQQLYLQRNQKDA